MYEDTIVCINTFYFYYVTVCLCDSHRHLCFVSEVIIKLVDHVW